MERSSSRAAHLVTQGWGPIAVGALLRDALKDARLAQALGHEIEEDLVPIEVAPLDEHYLDNLHGDLLVPLVLERLALEPLRVGQQDVEVRGRRRKNEARLLEARLAREPRAKKRDRLTCQVGCRTREHARAACSAAGTSRAAHRR